MHVIYNTAQLHSLRFKRSILQIRRILVVFPKIMDGIINDDTSWMRSRSLPSPGCSHLQPVAHFKNRSRFLWEFAVTVKLLYHKKKLAPEQKKSIESSK